MRDLLGYADGSGRGEVFPWFGLRVRTFFVLDQNLIIREMHISDCLLFFPDVYHTM